MDIIKRNLLRLLRSGALNEFEPLEPMSRYKWNQLFALSVLLRIDDLIEIGAYHNRFSSNSIPDDTFDKFCERIKQQMPQYDKGVRSSSVELCNSWLNKRLTNIRTKEPHVIDASMDTLQLLNLIVATSSAMFSQGLAIRETLFVGRFLRTKGQLVDFVKLDKWLHKLHLANMAQLIGNLLITTFGFDKDEIPFVHIYDSNAPRMVMRAFNGKSSDAMVAQWHFRQDSSGLVMGNTRASFKTLRRCMSFFTYAPLETLSTLMHGFVTSLSEIEE